MSNSKLQYPELDEARKAKLNEILEEIHTKASIDYGLQEMKDIQTTVHKMLERVVERVNKRGLFKISRIVPAGSMEEKTAMWKYSIHTGEIYTEFDYLGVLDCPRDIINTEFDYLGVLDCPRDIIHRYRKCRRCVRLREMPVKRNALHEYKNFPKRGYNNDRKRFDHLFWREINTCLGSDCDCFSITLKLNDNDERYWSLTYKLAEDCDPDYRCDKCVVEMPTGILRVNHSVSVGPFQGQAYCSLVFRWTSKASTISAYDRMLQEESSKINRLAIHVDFLPAIEVHQSGTHTAGSSIRNVTGVTPGLSVLTSDTAARKHDFFLVPKRCNVCYIDPLYGTEHWRKSNCLAEISHIVHDMSEKHKKYYKVIKYFLSIIAHIKNVFVNWYVNWYHVKTMVLNHSRECSDSSEGCAECVLKILAELKHAYETKRLNSFTGSNVSILPKNDIDQILYKTVIEAAIKILCSVTDSDSCTTILEREPTAVLKELEPACVTSTKDSCDLDNTGQVQDLTCSSDERSEKQILSPGSDISVETERALLLDFLQQSDTDSDDNSFDIAEVISEANKCSNCKRQPPAGVELKRCSRCHITKYCSVECQKKDWDFHRFACSVVAKSATKKT